jgi:uncharacterized membrane protein YcaP (DUF421 family)
MDSVLRGVVIYLVLLVVFRLAGRRTLAETTTFDFVLLLIISEAAQQGMVGNDYSLTTAIILIATLVIIDVGLSLLKQRFPLLEKIIDDVPVVLVEDGHPLKHRMDKARVAADDILESAREQRGLERMEQIKYAVLERSGQISIIPKQELEQSSKAA